MQSFNLLFTGDLVDAEDKPIDDLALDLLASAPHVRWGFIEDQQPRPNDPSYYDNLYSMEIAYSPHADRTRARSLGVVLVNTLDELLRRSDFIGLHGRLNDRTRGMIGQRELGLMKPTAFFSNVARGEMVDQPALVRCLQAGRIAGAGLDVFETEPLPPNDPLITLENVVLTPHWLATTRQSCRATVACVIEGMLRVSRGELPENILNPEVIDKPGFREKLQRCARQKDQCAHDTGER